MVGLHILNLEAKVVLRLI